MDQIREEAKGYSSEDIKGGGWFAKLLRSALDTYSKTVNWGYFLAKYPGLPADMIASRRIELAQRYAMIEGGLSASAYNAAIAATIGTKGGASPLTVPAGITSFTVDLLYTTRLQLRLAFDLAVIYRRPVRLDDAEDLYDLLRVAFGIKVGEVVRGALPRFVPEAVRQGIKATIKGQTLILLQKLPVVGGYLLQRNLMKFAIPAVGIPISMKLNHAWTGYVGREARQIYRDKLVIETRASAAGELLGAHAWLVLKVAFLVGSADGEFSAEETWFTRHLLASLSRATGREDLSEQFATLVEVEGRSVMKELSALPPPVRQAVYELSCELAACDHALPASEAALLQELAVACGCEFDLATLKKRAGSG